LDTIERVAVPLLLVQTASVVFLWSLDTLEQVSQTIFTLFLAADLLSFALISHLYLRSKTGGTTSPMTILIWGLVITAFFMAGFLFS